jgi:hypothetical protein
LEGKIKKVKGKSEENYFLTFAFYLLPFAFFKLSRLFNVKLISPKLNALKKYKLAEAL